MTNSSEVQTGLAVDEEKQHQAHAEVLAQIFELYAEMFAHDGFGDIRIEMRILRRGQKEVILHCGKQHRYVLDCKQALEKESAIKHLLRLDLLA